MIPPADAADGAGPARHALEHAGPPQLDSRALRRQRQEQELRLSGQRRAPGGAQAGDADCGPAAGADLLLDGAPVPEQPVTGSNDRMHHLALVPGRPPPAPAARRPPDDSGALLPPGPASRAECRRRCGKAGFCDPSDALGCGGEYCGNSTAAAREALCHETARRPGTTAPAVPPMVIPTDYL